MTATKYHDPAETTPGLGVVGPARPTTRPGRRTLPLSEWERANRLGLLVVHALIGVCAGGLILFTGAARVVDPIPAARPGLGTLALAGGLALLAGLLRRPRSIPLEIAGLSLLALWDLVMTASFVYGASAGTVEASWPWEPDGSSSTLYPIALYLGLFAMMCVHLVTLRHVNRAEVRRRMTVARV